MSEKFIGLYVPKRSKREVKKDTYASELIPSKKPVWVEKKLSDFKSYTERNQSVTNSCLAQSGAKGSEVYFVNHHIKQTRVFSASPIYNARMNKNHEKPEYRKGMWLHDMLDIIVNKKKLTLESRIKSQKLRSDMQMELEAQKWGADDDKIAQEHYLDKYAFIRADIDEIAGYIEAGYGVVITFFATKSEWSREFPIVSNKKYTQDSDEVDVFHGICGIDYGLVDGVKRIKIDDSAHFGLISQRYIDEEFIKTRVTGAGFAIRLLEPQVKVKPTKSFDIDLKYGMLKNPEVVRMQDALKYFGFMDETVPSTGNFLGESFRAVIRFQEHYRAEILIPNDLTLGTGNFYKSTRKQMNKLIAELK